MCEVYYDGDSPAFWREDERRARKAHRCDCCGGAIATGKRYVAQAACFDGHVSAEKMCRPCWRDMGRYAKAHGGFRWMASGFPGAVDQCIDDGEPGDHRWRLMRMRMRLRRSESTQVSGGGDR